MGDSRRDVELAWAFTRSGAVTVLSISDGDLPDIEALMRKYHDRPMDLADATLMHLAQRESLSSVFTIDHDDFRALPLGRPQAPTHPAAKVTTLHGPMQPSRQAK